MGAQCKRAYLTTNTPKRDEYDSITHYSSRLVLCCVVNNGEMTFKIATRCKILSCQGLLFDNGVFHVFHVNRSVLTDVKTYSY